ncbi:MAG: hypothetical protein KME33_03500 [Aetokthonos hydrillicola CCALA 1050]|nr:hypothetical protein [Aetokthonos hydrillicola]MBO3462016.1 hypothetical protein [Aetokthonos hydrillicola CCALA 1050]MBW4584281.1 hypothetical protein [Aetokthonos hydrillicola CCALA 1050]
MGQSSTRGKRSHSTNVRFLWSIVSFFYSWLQKAFLLSQVIVAIAPAMFVPLVLLSWGIQVSQRTVVAIFLLGLVLCP